MTRNPPRYAGRITTSFLMEFLTITISNQWSDVCLILGMTVALELLGQSLPYLPLRGCVLCGTVVSNSDSMDAGIEQRCIKSSIKILQKINLLGFKKAKTLFWMVQTTLSTKLVELFNFLVLFLAHPSEIVILFIWAMLDHPRTVLL